MKINGNILDNMLAWHVLNSALPKGLGFITPFYCQDMPMWKHLSGADPAGYNCQDSDATLRDFEGIEKDLRANNQWEVFERHVVKINEIFAHMSGIGVLRDEVKRNEAEVKLTGILTELEAIMVELVPLGARKIDKVFVNEPKDKTGLLNRPGIRSGRFCSHCGLARPRKDHFKRYVKKVNPCADDPGTGVQSREIEVVEWYRLREWKLSLDQLSGYQKYVGHKPILEKDDNGVYKVTFDEKAVLKLTKKYPNDPLYPIILKYRESQGLLSKYIGVTQEDGRVKGGLTVDKHSVIHTTFTHNPSTLRSAAQHPPLQQLPRPSKDPNALQNLIRNLIVARPGCTLYARDYSGIEAVLVGYFASAPRYIRLAKIDVHSYYTAYALHELDGRVKSADLPQVSWEDERLAKRLGEIKKEFGQDRNSLYKHLVHGANFMQGPNGAKEKVLAETGIDYPVSKVAKVMGVYFELFPEIKKWHHNLMLQAEHDGFLRNPFGYIHRFFKVFDYEKVGGDWKKEPGPDANKVIAFLPQSTAAGIIKEAMLRLFFNRYEEAGQYLRLLVHDELLSEVPFERVEEVDRVTQEEMERPIPELRLPASYGMGESLVILTEPKQGDRWGCMK